MCALQFCACLVYVKILCSLRVSVRSVTSEKDESEVVVVFGRDSDLCRSPGREEIEKNEETKTAL